MLQYTRVGQGVPLQHMASESRRQKLASCVDVLQASTLLHIQQGMCTRVYVTPGVAMACNYTTFLRMDSFTSLHSSTGM